MKEILNPRWKYGTTILYLVILISFSFIAYYNFNIGFRMSPDSMTYSKWADNLIRLNFNLIEYYKQNSFINPNYIYTIPILLIAFFKIIFGSAWQLIFMIFNLILVFFSFVLFSKSLLILKVRPLVISLGFLPLIISIDLLTWPRFILTDTIFLFIVLAVVFLIIKIIVKKTFYIYFLSFLMVLLFFTRPTSFPYIFAVIIFISFSKISINYTPKFIVFIIFLIFVFTPFIFAFIYQFIEIYLNNNPRAIFIIDKVESGIIIHDRPETWVDSPKTYFELVNLYFKRLFFFFTPYLKNFSLIHNLLNLFQSFIILVSLILWFCLGKKYDSENKTILFILLISILVAGFHSFTLIDYDFRYRTPIIIPLLIIFPISVEIFVRKIDKIFF